MLSRLVRSARAAASWPLDVANEIVQLPGTLRNIRRAAERMGPAIEDVGSFAQRADGTLTDLESTLRELGVVSKAISSMTSQAQAVNDQWRKTVRSMPIVGRVAAELERTVRPEESDESDESA